MRRSIPPRPSGTDQQAVWAQWVHDMLLASQINDSEDIKVSRDSRGVYLRSTIKGGGVAKSTPGAIKVFQITTVGGGLNWDYFKAKEIAADGTLISPEIIIAKQPEQRPQIPSVVIDTVQYDLVYTDDNNRTATVHGSSPPASQTEVCLPRYCTATIDTNVSRILAAKVPFTGVSVGGVQAEWIEIEDREWQRVAGQL